MNSRDISPMDLHSSLATLLFAIKEELGPLGFPRLTYDLNVYLQVIVETTGKNMIGVCDRLKHGVLWGPFDYRFHCIMRPLVENVLPHDSVEVSAMIDLSNSRAPSGPIIYSQTPSELRRRQREYEWGWR